MAHPSHGSGGAGGHSMSAAKAFTMKKSTTGAGMSGASKHSGAAGKQGQSKHSGKWHHGRRRWHWLYPGGGSPVSSAWVSWAQSCLARLVDPSVPQDGVMGPATITALQTFQSQHQLPPSGSLDSSTISSLQAACSAPPAGPPAAGPPPLPDGPPPPGPPAAGPLPAGPPPDGTSEVGEFDPYGQQETLNEMEEIAQAAELSGITSEQELDQFLGDLIHDAGKAVTGFVYSPAGQAVGGILKSAAKQILPGVGAALGGYVGGPAGAQIGSQLASGAGQIFGLEVGETGEAESDFEDARNFVKFARHAAKRAAAADPNLSPVEQAKAAVVEAAKLLAPGLVKAAQSIATNGKGSAVDPAERSFVSAKIAAHQTNPNDLADAVFYRRHPEMHGRPIGKNETALGKEWLSILHDVIEPLLTGSGLSGTTRSTAGTGDSDIAAVQAIAAKLVPGMPGVTIRQLLEKWRTSISPEIPLPVLLAFIRFESGGNFSDATHGSPRNNPPYTQPAFYELGLFQTPAGLHGTCTSGNSKDCEIPPPGRENPKDPSTWARLCQKIGADPRNWTDPVTQVRVGLLDLKTSADRIRAAFPDLFATPGNDWYLRAAVLLPFARGGGFSRAFLTKYRSELAKMPENRRWDWLRGKQVGQWTFDPANVDKKMALAAKLGYSS